MPPPQNWLYDEFDETVSIGNIAGGSRLQYRCKSCANVRTFPNKAEAKKHASLKRHRKFFGGPGSTASGPSTAASNGAQVPSTSSRDIQRNMNIGTPNNGNITLEPPCVQTIPLTPIFDDYELPGFTDLPAADADDRSDGSHNMPRRHTAPKNSCWQSSSESDVEVESCLSRSEVKDYEPGRSELPQSDDDFDSAGSLSAWESSADSRRASEYTSSPDTEFSTQSES
ncbi:hypothetical protein BC628DRAFT_1096855 [Trametes gibbosa]|nr:hypothetical protein BC628DRAFT_1096855 [Trametes gibbosa]